MAMKNLFGTMQGRLLPKYQGRYQAHPVDYWQDEFSVAADLDLDCIEFILDFNDAEKNPLLRDGGAAEILAVSQKTGVRAATICADYLMEAPIHSDDSATANDAISVVGRLLDVGVQIGISDIVIPCVDQSAIRGDAAMDRLKRGLSGLLARAENAGINLSLETDLGPEPFHDLLAEFDSKHLTVNYDTGNSAALGFDPIEELDAYGHRITDIHIKDRVRGGGPVMLGEGDAGFDRFFTRLKPLNFTGPFIMQAYRDDEGVAAFKQQLAWITPYFNKFQDA